MDNHRLKIRYFFFALAMSAILVACRTHGTISGNSGHEATVISKTDTFLVHDSCFIEHWNNVYIKGDTCYITKKEVEYRNRYIFRDRTDTFYIEKCDTIMVPHEVEKVVTTTSKILWYSLALNVAIIAFCVWRIRKTWNH